MGAVVVKAKRGAVGITATEYAEKHGVSPQRILQLVRAGKIPVLAAHVAPVRWYEIDPATPMPAMSRPPGWPRGVPKPRGAKLAAVLGGLGKRTRKRPASAP